jgi:hypothetical protein
MDLAAQLFPVGIGETEDLRIRDTVDIDRGPGAVIKGAVVGGPPGGHGELEDIHPGFVIDKKGLETTAEHEILFFDLFTLADDRLALLKRMLFKMGYEIVQLFVV